MRRSSEDGFSLIELLVVVVILAALMAIAVPTFLSQKNKAYASAMQADLHTVVVAENAWSTDHASPTSDPTLLAGEGYRQSSGVSLPHVKVTAAAFVACVRHESASRWLVYDSSTGELSSSTDDCA